jgi:hypothetical protein
MSANVILFVVFGIILVHSYIQTLLGRPIFFRDIREPYNGLNYNPDDLKAQLLSYVYNRPPHDPDTHGRTRNFGVYEHGTLGNAHSANFFNEETDLSKFFTAVPGPAEHGNMSIEDYTKELDKARNHNRKQDPGTKSLEYGLLPADFDRAADGSLMYRSDQWRYHNENMMNGGPINGFGLDGLTGVDPNGADYAVYFQ